jgi:hypothetical protein
MWRFSVHPILSNPLKYSYLKILYHDEEFLIFKKYTSVEGIYGDILKLSPQNPA